MRVGDEQFRRCCEAFRTESEEDEVALRRALEAMPEPAPVDRETLAKALAKTLATTPVTASEALYLVADKAIELCTGRVPAEKANDESSAALAELREQHEALRAGERDEARARVAELELELTTRPALEAVTKLEAACAEAKRKADDHRRQRDEAREELSARTLAHIDELAEARRLCDEAVTDRENAWVEVDALKAQLAARPEPVVIDEALSRELVARLLGGAPCWELRMDHWPFVHRTLRSVLGGVARDLTLTTEPVEIDQALAERLADAMWGESAHFGRSAPTLLSALRSVLGEQVCVSGHTDPHNDARRFEARLKQEIAYCQMLVRERDKLRAELAKLRELMARTDPCEEYTLQLRRIADAAGVDVPIDEVDVAVISAIGRLRAELQAAQAAHARAETHGDEPIEGQIAAPVPASLAPLTARLERIEAALRHFLLCRGRWRERADEALAMLDAGKQEVGK